MSDALSPAWWERGDAFRTVTDSVKDFAIFVLDLDGVVLTWNAGARAIKGYEADEIVGQSFRRFYPADEIEAGRPEAHLHAAMTDGRAEYEGWRLRKDGSLFWASIVISAVRDPNGQLVGFVKLTRDLTARRNAEVALRLSEERLRLMLQQQAAVSELGLFALRSRDLEAVMAEVARVAATTLGSDAATVLELEPGGAAFVLRGAFGLPPGLVGHAEVPAGHQSDAGYALLSEEPVVLHDALTEGRFASPPLLVDHHLRSGVSAVIHAPDHEHGAYGVFGAYSRGLRSFSGEDVHFVQAMANVLAAAIERRRAEERAEQAEKQVAAERGLVAEARSEVQQREDFISVAAHELRTPLSALRLDLVSVDRILAAAAAGGMAVASPQIHRRIERAVRQSERLSRLIERLLNASQLAEGHVELSREELDLAALCKEVIDAYREAAAKAGSEVRYHATGQATGSWDRIRLQEVLENLISNAIKYGEGRPIEIAVQPLEASVRLLVSDNGIGIAAEDTEKVFERYERGRRVGHKPGLGLGLYVTRQIVVAHGGTISVSSRLGQGTTFTVDLPRYPLSAWPSPPSDAAAAHGS